MFGNAFGWPHLLIILAIILLIFGAPKLPGLAKGITQSMRIFKTEFKGDKKTDEQGTASQPDPQASAAQQAATQQAADQQAADLAAQQAAANAAAQQVAAQQAAARQAAAQQAADQSTTYPPKS